MDNGHDNNYDHVLKYTWLFGGVQGLIIAIGLVRNKAMALLLGVAGMGFASLMSTMQNFAAQCTNLGIGFGAVPRLSSYYESEDFRQLNHYIMVIRLWSMMAALLGLLFCLLLSPFADRWTFTWGDHTLHYSMLGFSVGMLAITGGEIAILKATRRLEAVASIQIYMAVASVLISVPLYYFWGHSGIVPAIVLTALASMVITMGYSYRCHPLRLSFRKSIFVEGASMIRLGVAFVVAAAIGSGAEMLVRSFLNVAGSMDDVGYYNAAYMIAITYAGMVFSAMDTDYFPRLSAVSNDVEATNETVNKQMEVSLLLLSPMIVGLLTMLPVLVPLLFSSDFLPVVGMAQLAVLAMYLKALTLPVAYITLARSYSVAYFFLETTYFVVFVLAIALGYYAWGIYGTGIAIVLAHVFDYLMINGFAWWKYGYRCTRQIGCYAAVQLTLGVTAFLVSLWADGWTYWITEAALTVVSTAYSIHVLRQKTHLWQSLMRKLRT